VPDEKMTTREKILQIIEGMEQAGSLMTISGVARAAEVSNSTIHNRYPDLAERIRASDGVVREKDLKTQLARRQGKIKEEKAKRTRVSGDLEKVKESLRKVNSVNAALQFENAALKAQLDELRRQSRAQVSQIVKSVTR
jgi:chromosome segregation ATPase